jgi:hypothetical protein
VALLLSEHALDTALARLREEAGGDSGAAEGLRHRLAGPG